MNSADIQQIPLFFILGRPRSGTSLLRTLFDAHPNVKIPPEYPLFLLFYQRYKKKRRWSEEDIDSLLDELQIKKISRYLVFDHLQIDKEVLRSRLLAMREDLNIKDVIKLINYSSGSLYPKEEITLIGDKNPVYTVYANRIIGIYPEARFICIIRDPRDSFVSMRKFEFEATNPFLQASRWKYVIRMFRRMHQKYPGSFLLIRYEDLVSKPAVRFQEMCNFLEIPFTDKVFAFYKKIDESTAVLPRDVLMKYMKSLRDPVNTKKIGLYKKELDKTVIRTFDLVAGKELEKMGYERQYLQTNLRVTLRSLPFRAYTWMLFRIMVLFSYMPYAVSRIFAGFLPRLARFYHRMKGAGKPA